MGLIYFDEWVGALFVALAAILWRSALQLEYRS